MADPRHLTGIATEEAVSRWLGGAGWRVLDRRCRPGAGAELDIVALDPRGTLVGVECRARRSPRTGSPAETVTPGRVARLRRAVSAYAVTSGVRHRGLRVDLVSASPEPGGTNRWRLVRIEGIG